MRRIWVFDPSATGQVESRLMKLLRSGASERFGMFKLLLSAMKQIVSAELP